MLLLPVCGGLASRQAGGGGGRLTFGTGSPAPAGPRGLRTRAYIRVYVCKSRSIWTRRPVGGSPQRRGTARGLYPQAAGPISAMGCDAMRSQPAASGGHGGSSGRDKKGKIAPRICIPTSREARARFAGFWKGCRCCCCSVAKYTCQKRAARGPPGGRRRRRAWLGFSCCSL